MLSSLWSTLPSQKPFFDTHLRISLGARLVLSVVNFQALLFSQSSLPPNSGNSAADDCEGPHLYLFFVVCFQYGNTHDDPCYRGTSLFLLFCWTQDKMFGDLRERERENTNMGGEHGVMFPPTTNKNNTKETKRATIESRKHFTGDDDDFWTRKPASTNSRRRRRGASLR